MSAAEFVNDCVEKCIEAALDEFETDIYEAWRVIASGEAARRA